MHINVEEVKKRLSKLEKLLMNAKGEDERLNYSRDISTLKIILSYLSDEKYTDFFDVGMYGKYTDIKNNEAINFFNRYSKDIYKSLYCYAVGIKLPWRVIRDTKISSSDYFKLLEDFFKKYDERLLDLYKVMEREERIELLSKKYVINRSALGLNIHLTSFNDSYIFSRFNNRISTSSILPHELGHAYLLDETSTTEGLINKSASLFSEAYSIFLELVFFDYLKGTKYSKCAIREEYGKLDSFLLLADYQYGSILGLQNMSVKDGNLYSSDGKVVNTYTSKLMLSDILAMHLLNLYRSDRKMFERELDAFFYMFGSASDEEIMAHYNLNDMIDSTRTIMNSYVRNFKKK